MLHAKITRRNLIKSALMLLSANILLPSFQKSEAAEAKTDFYISKIDSQMFSRIKGKSYKDDCTLPLDDLRYLHLLHKDLHGKTREGELICNVYIAAPLLDIFMKLHEANYAIEKIRLIDEYDADDETSMRDNNSSCFNFRFISHTNKISK
ncbi:MAG: hypothetical protein IJT01_01510, partial [Selenomonadaceae bacterium]|nr:hypothetical protein [Selenomonadaceae bacterium]